MNILLTGAAGYIGSHVARLLQHAGHEVFGADDLSTGFAARFDGKIEHVDLAAADAVERLKASFVANSIDAVVHLAARKQVGESVEKPEWYYSQNVGGLANLLTAMRETNVQKLLFSSSAAVYGMPDDAVITEEIHCQPINPYGETKLIGEWLVADAGRAWGLKHVSLRYFNVAGAGWADLADTAVANLIPIAFAAIRAGSPVRVFGDDYPTADGSCVRDYIHVLDLAKAHQSALEYLDEPNREHDVFNVGTGTGASVFEVLAEIKKQTGLDFEVSVESRRAGDPPQLSADVSRIRQSLNWQAQHDLASIVSSAWQAN
jgi:UDP-glucose 4-epimerase